MLSSSWSCPWGFHDNLPRYFYYSCFHTLRSSSNFHGKMARHDVQLGIMTTYLCKKSLYYVTMTNLPGFIIRVFFLIAYINLRVTMTTYLAKSSSFIAWVLALPETPLAPASKSLAWNLSAFSPKGRLCNGSQALRKSIQFFYNNRTTINYHGLILLTFK